MEYGRVADTNSTVITGGDRIYQRHVITNTYASVCVCVYVYKLITFVASTQWEMLSSLCKRIEQHIIFSTYHTN